MYYVYPPAFTLDSSGTTITVRYTISESASLTLPPGTRPMTDTTFAPMGSRTYNQEKLALDFTGIADTSYESQQRSYQVGYAITSGVSYTPTPNYPTQNVCVAVGPPLPTRYRVSGQSSYTDPVISQTELAATFPLPLQASTFWPVFKIVNTVGTGYTEGQWYGSTNSYIVPTAGGSSYDVTAYGTWFSPGISISASGGASVGNTSRLTITVPNSVRTLTVNDFTASGGTLSNFTRVS